MEKFCIRYHTVDNKEIMDFREFDTFAEAVSMVAKGVKNETIGIVKSKGHVVEIKTKYITHHEVMSKDVYKKQLDLANLNNLVKSSLIHGWWKKV